MKKKPLVRTPEEQQDAETLIKRVVSSVTGYHDKTRKAREASLEDYNFNLGGENQWAANDVTKMRAEERPVLTFNFSGGIVNFLAGFQAEREQDYRAFPRGTEDERVGRISTALLKYGCDTTRATHTFHQGFRKGIIGGQSVFEVCHSFDLTDDLLEGDLRLELLERDTWGCELGARRYDRNDAAYQFKLMWMNKEDAQRKWKHHAESISTGLKKDWIKEDSSLTGVPSQFLDQLVDRENNRLRVLQYWYRKPIEVALVVNLQTGEVRRMESEQAAEDEIRRIFDTAGAQAAALYGISKVRSQSALINQQTGAVHTFQKPEYAEEALSRLREHAGKQAASQYDLITRETTSLRVANVTGWEMLDDKPSPYGSDWRFPFVPFTCYQDTDDVSAVKGVIRDIKDPQREINWHYSTILDTMMRGPKGGVWVNKAENVDIEDLRKRYPRAGFIGEYTGQPPIPVIPQQLSEGDMAAIEFSLNAIMRISGINAEMMGQTTQKTVSGRAIQSRQAGGIVGVGTIFINWQETKTVIGNLLLHRIQQFYSPEKMDRVIGQEQRMLGEVGLLGPQAVPDHEMYEIFKQVSQIEMDVVVDFQESSPTARQAVAGQLMQLKAAGAPVPLALIIEAVDPPFKQEILSALQKQGEQPANPELSQVISAGQGSSPSGVNTSQ